jgi:CheY-like chemotaxis protein
VLVNLVANAVKFTERGEVVIEVCVVNREHPGVTVRFEVRDTGIGIARDRIDRMFDAFSQADAKTTRMFGGTGLGLAISRELTNLMGGSIGAESEPGRGSTFWFELPFTLAEGQVEGPAAATDVHGLHVLVVDDNATNRRILEAYVAAWRMRPAVVADAREAIDELQRSVEHGDPFDVALLDFNLPGANGLELAERIAATPALRNTRLILLSSTGQLHDESSERRVGYHLTKPVRQSRLLDAIGAVMAGGDVRREQPVREEAPGTEPNQGGAGRHRVLVAEDQRTNWMLIERLLARRGLSAVNATDGRDVLAKLESDGYDLVLMDCQMPVLDGYDAAREIRRREDAEHRAHVPIVAMTASAMEGDRERCLAAGMDDYIPKPVDSDKLDQLLRRWLPDPEPTPPIDTLQTRA